jgi:PIN domain nuclease of toxin-antitoxin system
MANYLLDTHAVIWFFEESPQLSGFGHEAIRHYQNNIYLNVASLWEIAIKTNIKKLDLGVTIEEFIFFCKDNYIQILPISSRYLSKYIELPLLHKDPFDRLIVANSLVDDLKIFTKDDKITQYNVQTIW